MPQRRTWDRTRTTAKVAAAWCVAAVGAIFILTAHAQDRLPGLGPLENGRVTYFIAPPEADAAYRDGDRELATWALADWERAARGQLHFEPGDEESALLHIFFVGPGGGQYGEMVPVLVDGRRGAAVFIRPDTDAFGPDIADRARSDSLYRDTIVYLTCVHEIGHALGLEHTANYADVMFFFGYGGDIPHFFGRYRDKLEHRSDIANVSGLSVGDTMRLREIYPVVTARAESAPDFFAQALNAAAFRFARASSILEPVAD